MINRKVKSVRFSDVVVGDLVHDNLYYHKPNRWREVTGVKIEKNLVSIQIGFSGHPTIDTRTNICGRPFEYIAVKRLETSNLTRI